MFATKLDCQLVQVFVVVPVAFREQGAGWLLEIILNMNFDLTQDGGQSSYVIIHDM